MNTYKKYCENVFVAECDKEHEKGDIITVTTKRGKENDCQVHNYLGQLNNGRYCYSITRCDGYDTQAHYAKKADRASELASKSEAKSIAFFEASREGEDFLRLGEPIKIGHHSEKRHRSLIDRNHRRMEKSVEAQNKAEEYAQKSGYYDYMTEKIDLSMPESVKHFENKLNEAKEKHLYLKNNPEKRAHSYSLTYAKKEVNNMQRKLDLALKLWA